MGRLCELGAGLEHLTRESKEVLERGEEEVQPRVTSKLEEASADDVSDTSNASNQTVQLSKNIETEI